MTAGVGSPSRRLPQLLHGGQARIIADGLAIARARFDPRPVSPGVPAPEGWQEWLTTMYPRSVAAGFAPRHEQLWSWVWGIGPTSRPRPLIAVWPRGGGKTTSAELASAALGLRGMRFYCLYVRLTQDLADTSVGNIAALLEAATVAKHYPQHAERKLSKYGQAKAWRRSRLITAGGFVVDALGLDVAARGVKVEDQRPDLIVLDDIDEKHDTPAATAKKRTTITTSILPAGSATPAILGIQNLIHADGIFSQLTDGRAEFLAERMVSGPYKAVDGLKYEWRYETELGQRVPFITAGRPTWDGQDLETCQTQMRAWGPDAFLKEAQHEVYGTREGIVLRYDHLRHLEDLTDAEARALVALGQVFAGIDFGSWRFAFVLRAVDRQGVVHQIGELFIQRENSDYKARLIDAVCRYYGCPPTLTVWGDCANQAEIMDLNAALERVHKERLATAAKVGPVAVNAEPRSAYSVTAIAHKSKIKDAGIERMNDLLDRNALKYRRGVMRYMQLAVEDQLEDAPDIRTWRHGYNASSAGTVMSGSRLQWEAGKWGYPPPKEGETQAQEPDDDTADGADATDADRYALMSTWDRAAEAPDEPVNAFDPDVIAKESEYMRYDHSHESEHVRRRGRRGR